jgi:hypothetical protein
MGREVSGVYSEGRGGHAILYRGDRVDRMKTMGSSHAKGVDVVFDEVCIELWKLLVDVLQKMHSFWRCFRFHDVFHITQSNTINFHSPSLLCVYSPLLTSSCFEPNCV